MVKILLFFIVILGISFINSQDTIVLSGTIYDQSPARNPDFEIPNAPNALVEGIVLQDIGSDNTPTYCCGDNPVLYGNQIVVHNSTTFSSWFHEISGVSYAIPYDLTLTLNPNTGLYVYQSSAFFPIDGQGFDNKTLFPNEITYNGHNYHFCMAINYGFEYHGGEFFTFSGDDDVWVFFDGKLLIDIGGLHTSVEKTVYMDDLSLTVGGQYTFNFFYCERHTSQSNLNIFTNLNFTCIEYDACGVCQGKNDTCCFVHKCDVFSQCLIDNCGADTNYTCIYENVNCDDANECTIESCDPGFGCISIPRMCFDDDACTTDSCDPGFGCLHIPINCNNGSACSIDSCDSLLGCQSSPVNCEDNNVCTLESCNPLVGCEYTQASCDDFNKCTVDSCTQETGCQHSPLDCSDDNICTIDSCDAGFGCLSFPRNCDDDNHCTIDSCGATGCVHEEIPLCVECPIGNCVQTDLCIPLECNPLGPNLPCIENPINCTSSNPCILGTCVRGSCSFDTICTETPTMTPTQTPTVSPTVTPTVTPTPTPTPTPSIRPPRPPPSLHKNCLHCIDLGCEKSGKRCTYLENEKYNTAECKENCCSHTPTCY